MKCYLAQLHKIKDCEQCYAKETCQIYNDYNVEQELKYDEGAGF